jgi:hypothetical protein
VATVVYILNHSPTQSVDGQTPYEVWHGARPSIHHMHTFGCVAHVKQGNKRLAKLEDCSTPIIFIGYEQGSKAWQFYDTVSRRVHMSCATVFKETRPWEWSTEDQGVVMGHEDPFMVEHVAVHAASGLAPVAPGRRQVMFSGPWVTHSHRFVDHRCYLAAC